MEKNSQPVVVEKEIQMTHTVVKEEKIVVTIDNTIGIQGGARKPHYTFLLFVNNGSGDSKAALLTKLDVERMIFSTFNPQDADIEVRIYSLRDPANREKGINTLKKLQAENLTKVRVIVGGGDGSIMWAVQEMIAAHVNFEKLVIGTIPFGTGNDFSRVTGWGPTEPKVLLGTHLNNFKSLISQWVDAKTIPFDIWEITIETHENGGLKQIHRAPGKKFEKKFMSFANKETGKEETIHSFRKLMCNYFSFGIDSRIGYGFDKGRTKSRLGNKFVYCWEGFKKNFSKTPRVNDVVENIQVVKMTESGEEIPLKQTKEMDQQFEFDDHDFLMYPGIHIEKAKEDAQTHKNVSVIKGNPSVFLCLNIPSYMGGASDPWRTSKGKMGAHTHDKSPINDFAEQSIGDGKIEILAFGGPLSMAAERMIPGQGRRLGQAKGPFVVNFKKGDEKGKPIHTYMQIDGEFYDVVAPKRVRVSLCPLLPDGKIQVLENMKNKK